MPYLEIDLIDRLADSAQLAQMQGKRTKLGLPSRCVSQLVSSEDKVRTVLRKSRFLLDIFYTRRAVLICVRTTGFE